MTWTRRAIVASLVMGAVGAVIGGFLASATAAVPYGDWDYTLLPLGAVPAFLSCFFVSIWYLGFMQNLSGEASIGFGLLFGMLAGVISGFITLIGVDLATGGHIAGGGANWATRLLASAFFGIPVGAVTGFVVGLISALVPGAMLLKYLTGRR